MEDEQIKKFDWSKWGFVLAIFLFIITFAMWIYQTYYYKSLSDLSYEIISNEEVLTLKEDIPNLQILYDEINLRESSKNISILIFKVINRGNESILINHYDENIPLGFVIKNGTILVPPSIIKSSDQKYFIDPIQKVKKDTVFFKNLIIDDNSYFDVKCLILNEFGNKPLIEPLGKIAGINKIKVLEFSEVKSNKSIFENKTFLILGFSILVLAVLYFFYHWEKKFERFIDT